MSTKVFDTLKPQGDFPVAFGEDIRMNDGRNLEEAICDEVYFGEAAPTDERTKLWIDDSSNFAEDKLDVLADYNEYSDEEIVIGQYMGKPLYRKVIDLGNVSVPYNTWTYVANEQSSIQPKSATFYDTKNVPYSVAVYNNNGSIEIMHFRPSVTLGTEGALLILEYTKTTDEADSFHPSMIKTFPSAKRMVVADFEDYSTDEIVIGRWIDGRPIYRRTFEGTSVASAVLLEIDPSIRCISLKGYINKDNDMIFEYNSYYSSGLFICVYQQINHNGKNTVIMYVVGSAYVGKPCVTTIEYIKTTDSPNSFDPNMLSTATMKYDATDDEVAEVLG